MTKFAVVRVTQGVLRGRKMTSATGEIYYSFQGIPYAKPPVGNLRFQAPQPPEPWGDVRDALVEGSVAPHLTELPPREYVGDEDCLFLNVYTPKLPEASTNAVKPVMVWIHGGAFYIGSGNSDLYGPEHLINEDVVVVTINYRLGALGFLSTGDSVVPGNNGLKDQVMALRWVQQNIAQFGGDPGNVTIFGESAGAASVHLQQLSPMAKGLFHRGIAQSGSALSPWAFEDPSDARRKAFRFGEVVGCSTNDSKTLLEFLMKVSARDLVEAMERSVTEEEKHPLPLCFFPTKERSRNGEEVFLPDSPMNIISQGKFHKVPLIIGINSNEGMFVIKDIDENPLWYEALNETFSMPVPHNFKIERNTATFEEVRGKIKDFYFGTKPISKETWQKLADLYGDLWFVSGVFTTVKKQAAISPVPIYFYHFAFEGKLNMAETWLGSNRLPGACHADELGYLFQNTVNANKKLDPDDDSARMLSRMVKMWTNFAKSGNPTPKADPLLGVTWTPTTTPELNYLNIDTKLSMETDLLKARMDFWEEMYESYESSQ